jgi:hypothetical protein
MKAKEYISRLLGLSLSPLNLLFKAAIHYLVLWPWWIVLLSVRNVRGSLKKRYLMPAFIAISVALFVFLVFMGTGLMMGVDLLFIVGIAYGILPVIWVFGEIAFLRQTENIRFIENPKLYKSSGSGFGYVVLRPVICYFLIFILLLLLQIFLNLTVTIKPLTYSIPGFVLAINTVLSMIMLMVFVILLFSSFMMPSYVLTSGNMKCNIPNSISFLGDIGRKFLKFLFVQLPAVIIAIFLSILPALLVFLSLATAIQIKDVILENGIKTMEAKMQYSMGVGQYRMESKIDRYNYYKNFPENFFLEGNTIHHLQASKIEMQKNVESARYILEDNRKIYKVRLDSMVSLTKSLEDLGSPVSFSIKMKIDSTLRAKKISFESWENYCEEYIIRNELKIDEVQARMLQLPFFLFFIIVGLSIFGGFIMAGPVAFLGNLYYSLYHFREDKD